MLIVLTASGAYLVYLAVQAVLAAIESLRNLPRSNEDWIFF